jgi:hypothetical protein
MKKIVFYFILLIFISCTKNHKENHSRKDKATIEKDTFFTRTIFNIKSSKKNREEIEIYVSNHADTIFNQHKMFINDKVDSTQSCFYELKITPTSEKHVYSAIIKFNSDFKMKTIDKAHRMQIWFSYREETKDSTFFSDINVSNRNKIAFRYTNIKDNGIQGIIIQNVEIDTVIKKEKMVHMRERKLLVDNLITTLNFSLEPFDFYKENRFKIDGKKIKKD